MLRQLLVIAAGGAVGAVGRYAVTGLTHRLFGAGFPYGTLAVNVIGSFLIGYLFVLFIERLALGEIWRLMAVVGMLGSFTTFSTFSLETLILFQEGEYARAAANVALSVVVCIGACALGIALARSL